MAIHRIRFKIGYLIAKIGSHIWETNGFWIDKEHNVGQDDYTKLPILGKFGYKITMLGLKIWGITIDEIIEIMRVTK